MLSNLTVKKIGRANKQQKQLLKETLLVKPTSRPVLKKSGLIRYGTSTKFSVIRDELQAFFSCNFCYTHKFNGPEIRNFCNDVRERMSAKTPSGVRIHTNYERGQIEGIIRFHQMEILNHRLDHCYLAGGELFSTRRITVHKKTSILHALDLHQSEWDSLLRGFFWKGTDIPYDEPTPYIPAEHSKCKADKENFLENFYAN